MRKILLLISSLCSLLILNSSAVLAQSGAGIFTVSTCSTISNPVNNGTWCLTPGPPIQVFLFTGGVYTTVLQSITQDITVDNTGKASVLATHLLNPLPLNQGGTASTTAAGARTSLGAAASGVNLDITSLIGISGGIINESGGIKQQGATQISALGVPAAPTLTVNGTAGTTSYTYFVVCHDGATGVTLPSAGATITTGNATLSTSNSITISPPSKLGCLTWDVLKGTTASSIALGVLAGNTFTDIGGVGSAYTAPTRDTTGNLTAVGVTGLIGGSVTGDAIAGGMVNTIQSATQLNANGVINVQAFGASGLGLRVTTGSTTAPNSTTLTLASATGWSAGQGIMIEGAVPLTLAAPALGTASVAIIGTPGTTTYTYRCTALTARLGESLPSDPALTTLTTTTGNANLSTTNYNIITCPTSTGAFGYGLWLVAGPVGRTLNTLIGLSTSNTFADTNQTTPYQNSFWVRGWCPVALNANGVCTALPTTVQNEYFLTTISSVSGNNVILNGFVPATVTNTNVSHDDTPAFTAAQNAAITNLSKIDVPQGTYGFFGAALTGAELNMHGSGRRTGAAIYIGLDTALYIPTVSVSQISFSDLQIFGGDTVIHSTFTIPNVNTSHQDIERVNLQDYVHGAIAFESTDMPYSHIFFNNFQAFDDINSISVLLPGTSGNEVCYNSFSRNRVAIKEYRAGQGDLHCHNAYLRGGLSSGLPRWDVWLVPGPNDGTSQGPGFVERDSKFGNENRDVGDGYVLIDDDITGAVNRLLAMPELGSARNCSINAASTALSCTDGVFVAGDATKALSIGNAGRHLLPSYSNDAGTALQSISAFVSSTAITTAVAAATQVSSTNGLGAVIRYATPSVKVARNLHFTGNVVFENGGVSSNFISPFILTTATRVDHVNIVDNDFEGNGPTALIQYLPLPTPDTGTAQILVATNIYGPNKFGVSTGSDAWQMQTTNNPESGVAVDPTAQIGALQKMPLSYTGGSNLSANVPLLVTPINSFTPTGTAAIRTANIADGGRVGGTDAAELNFVASTDTFTSATWTGETIGNPAWVELELEAASVTGNWVASTGHVVGDLIKPLTNNANGYYFMATAVTAPGTTGTVNPTFPQVVGATVVDNLTTWTNVEFGLSQVTVSIKNGTNIWAQRIVSVPNTTAWRPVRFPWHAQKTGSAIGLVIQPVGTSIGPVRIGRVAVYENPEPIPRDVVIQGQQFSVNNQINVATKATGGLGTLASPYTGWDTAITWTANTNYYFPAAYFSYTVSPNFGLSGLKLFCENNGSANTVLQFNPPVGCVGTACHGLVFDAGAGAGLFSNNQRVDNCLVSGNANAKDGYFVRGVNRSVFNNVRATNFSAACFETQGAVLDSGSIHCSGNEGAFTTTPVNGALFGARAADNLQTTAGAWYVIAEGVTGSGIKLAGTEALTISGTSENNTGRGLEMAAPAVGNNSNDKFLNLDLESNTIEDALISNSIHSTFDTLISSGTFHIAGAGALDNLLIGGVYNNITIDAGSKATTLQNLGYNSSGTGVITDNGTNTTWNPPIVNVTNGFSSQTPTSQRLTSIGAFGSAVGTPEAFQTLSGAWTFGAAASDISTVALTLTTEPWRVVFRGNFYDNFNGAGLAQQAPYIEVTSAAPTFAWANGVTITLSVNATTKHLQAAASVASGIGFAGTIEVFPNALSTAGTNSINVKGGITTAGALTGATAVITTSVLQGGGMKHQRVTTGSLLAGSFNNITLTWTTAFADVNYTPVCSVTDATSAAVGLSVDHIQSVTAASVVAVVKNGAAGALTGTLNCAAMHD